jgi:TPR repeat protein
MLLQLAKDGFPEGQHRYAQILESSGDFQQAFRYFEQASAKGFNNASVEVARMYLLGRGVPRDIDRAVEILEQASIRLIPTALCTLGDFYRNDIYERKDVDRALELFRKAAAEGFVLGKLKYAVMLRTKAISLAVEKPEEAQELNRTSSLYMREAAIEGDKIAQYNFAKFLLDGIGVGKDTQQAKAMLVSAVGNKHIPAFVLLGDILYNGSGGTAPDQNEAIRLWEEAAAMGSGEAAKRLTNHKSGT